MPLIVVHVSRAKPAITFVAEHGGGFIAGLIEQGDGLTGRPWFLVRILPGRLCFHDYTRAAIVLPQRAFLTSAREYRQEVQAR